MLRGSTLEVRGFMQDAKSKAFIERIGKARQATSEKNKALKQFKDCQAW